MDLLKSIFLALIQGLSEFLPVSSSAHLILPSQLFAWEDQGLAFDVAVHVGSLLAVVIYFRKELVDISSAIVRQPFSSRLSPLQLENAKLGWLVVAATIPAVIVAFVAKDFIESNLRSTTVIATTTIFFGLLLGFADWWGKHHRKVNTLTLYIALLIGFAQVLALIPGTSRSGVTITAALLLGLGRSEAARFSFLLSIPIILAAGVLLSLDLTASDDPVDWTVLSVGVVVSGLSAWACIALFLRLVERVGFMPFVVYRLALGAVLLSMM